MVKQQKKLVTPNNFGTSSSLKLLSRQEALELVRKEYNPYDWDYIDYIIAKQESSPKSLETPKEAIAEARSSQHKTNPKPCGQGGKES